MRRRAGGCLRLPPVDCDDDDVSVYVSDKAAFVEVVVFTLGWLVISVLCVYGASKCGYWLVHRQRITLAGRWVVVTGCDSGIGRAVVDRLLRHQCRVIACCRSELACSELRENGVAAALQIDLTKSDEILSGVSEILEVSDGRLWGVVHCAGIVKPGFIDYLPSSYYRDVMEVNFFAVVDLTRRLLPALRESRGRCVMVSSVDGLVSLPGNAPYDASKFALEAFADALRVELSFWKIFVSVVNPSTLRTSMSESFFELHRNAWQAMESEDPGGEWRRHWPLGWLEKFIAKNTENLRRIAEDPVVAVHDIEHALSSRHPKLRYLSGTLAKTFFYMLWVAPESVSAKIKRMTIQPPPLRKS